MFSINADIFVCQTASFSSKIVLFYTDNNIRRDIFQLISFESGNAVMQLKALKKNYWKVWNLAFFQYFQIHPQNMKKAAYKIIYYRFSCAFAAGKKKNCQAPRHTMNSSSRLHNIWQYAYRVCYFRFFRALLQSPAEIHWNTFPMALRCSIWKMVILLQFFKKHFLANFIAQIYLSDCSELLAVRTAA